MNEKITDQAFRWHITAPILLALVAISRVVFDGFYTTRHGRWIYLAAVLGAVVGMVAARLNYERAWRLRREATDREIRSRWE